MTATTGATFRLELSRGPGPHVLVAYPEHTHPIQGQNLSALALAEGSWEEIQAAARLLGMRF